MESPTLPHTSPLISRPPEQVPVAVIGAGAMGTGIGQVAAQAGHPVHLVDARDGAAGEALAKLGPIFDRLVAKGRVTRDDADTTLTRITPYSTADMTTVPTAGLVIEAVVEHLDIKRQIFRQLEGSQDPATVFATNTSSLPIELIAAEATTGHDAAIHGGRSPEFAHPGRLIGLHFFNPPPLMRLVEVIGGANSDEAILTDAVELMRRWGKTPVRCASTPGFIVNRIARPYYGEAQRMVAEGIADAATIDYALTAYAGFRMGPMALSDLVGNDVNYAVGESVWRQTGGDPRYEPTELQHDLVRAGKLGRKSGAGFYRYTDSQPVDVTPDEALAARLVGGELRTDPVARTLAMLVNEGVDLVHRGEASASDVDVAMRLGTNYPKGPFEWLDELGADVVAERLAELDRIYPGGRYRPSEGLRDV